VTPRVLDLQIVDREWQFIAGWPDASSDNSEDLALRFHSHLFGLGGAISVFEGAQNHRLIFTCTPVDDECSDLVLLDLVATNPHRHLRRAGGQAARAHRKAVPVHRLRRSGNMAYQKYVEHPPLSKVDAKGYMALRKWATQFCDVPTLKRHEADD